MTDEPVDAPGPSSVPAGAAPRAGAHLDLDALADALVGEPVDDAHLDSCASCRARLAELEAADAELSSSLDRLGPPDLPDDVLRRWQEALTAEAPPAGVVDLRQRQRRRSRSAGVPATVAASLVLALAATWGWTALRDGGLTAGDTASTAAGGSSESSDDSDTSGTETESDTGSGGGGTDDPAAGTALDQDARVAAEAAVPASATGRDYADAGERSAAVAQVLAGAPAAEAAPPATASAPDDGLARLRDPRALAGCLSVLDGPALAVDYARHDGRPALAVLRPADDPGVLAVTVVAAGCSAADPQVLLRTSVPRPG